MPEETRCDQADDEAPDDPREDPNRVDPAEHRGQNAGLLGLKFKLKGHRRPDDIAGPRPLSRDDDEGDHEADEDEDCEP